ncbi:hypothetical protein Mapa_016946 [Marchantia paleacea]|nr:hypothetical protein Mapa_016946 [Marchantia paleacea]
MGLRCGYRKTQKSTAWQITCGMTFPGKPFGRFSAGLVKTDFTASKVLHQVTPNFWLTRPSSLSGHELRCRREWSNVRLWRTDFPDAGAMVSTNGEGRRLHARRPEESSDLRVRRWL